MGSRGLTSECWKTIGKLQVMTQSVATGRSCYRAASMHKGGKRFESTSQAGSIYIICGRHLSKNMRADKSRNNPDAKNFCGYCIGEMRNVGAILRATTVVLRTV